MHQVSVLLSGVLQAESVRRRPAQLAQGLQHLPAHREPEHASERHHPSPQGHHPERRQRGLPQRPHRLPAAAAQGPRHHVSQECGVRVQQHGPGSRKLHKGRSGSPLQGLQRDNREQQGEHQGFAVPVRPPERHQPLRGRQAHLRGRHQQLSAQHCLPRPGQGQGSRGSGAEPEGPFRPRKPVHRQQGCELQRAHQALHPALQRRSEQPRPREEHREDAGHHRGLPEQRPLPPGRHHHVQARAQPQLRILPV